MNNAQLYLAIGMPTVVALIGILVNVGYFVAMNGRMGRIEDRLDILVGKVAEMDTEMGRIKERLGMK